MDNRGASPGLILDVAGANVVIADIYDRPISLIQDRIAAYWQGPDANA